MGQHNQWLKPVLGKGVAMLLLLRLKNSPTEELIQPTLEAWYRIITYKKAWEEQWDKPRFEAAFMTLGQTCDWFPTPKQLLDRLPPRVQPELPPPPPLTAEQLAAERKQQARHVKRLKALLKGK